METRKIQLAGRSTFTVSLPKDWAAEQGLEPGSHVHLFPHMDGSLVLREAPDGTGDGRHLDLAVGGHDGAVLAQTVEALYGAGFDRLRFQAPDGLDADQRRAIVDAARDLVGVGVTDEGADRVVLETLLDGSDVSVVQSMHQLRFVTLSMLRTANEALLDADDGSTEVLVERADEAHRLRQLVERSFKRSLTDLGEVDRLEVGRPTLYEYHRTAAAFGQVADHAVAIGRLGGGLASSAPATVQPTLEVVANDTREVVQTAANVHLGEGSVDAAQDTLSTTERLHGDIDMLHRELSNLETAPASRLTRAACRLKGTTVAGAAIARTAVQAAARGSHP